DVLLQAGAGTLKLKGEENASAAAVRLGRGGDINQSSGTIMAEKLGAIAVGGISFTSATNSANTVAFANTGAGTIAYQGVAGFTVDTVGALTLGIASFASTPGVLSFPARRSSDLDVLLQAGAGTL